MRRSQPSSCKSSKRIELTFEMKTFISCSVLVCFEIFCHEIQYAKVLHQHTLKALSHGHICDPLN